MKIKKLQSGGYLSYESLPIIPDQAPVQQAGAQAEEKPKDEGLDQDVLKKMIGEGITTDVMAYSNQVKSAYERYSMMDDNMKNSYAGRQLRQVMKGDLGQLNALWRGKKMLDASIDQAKSNDGLNELAVTNDGVIVKDTESGAVTSMTFAQLAQNGRNGKYRPITNAELAEEREYNPALLGNKTVFSIIGYAKGIDKIREEALKVASSIGSTSISKASGGYGGEPSGESASDILEAAAANGAFKIKDGQTETTNVPQIRAAQRALWNSLSDNSKSVLRARAALEVKDPRMIEAAAYNIAADLLNPHESTISREVHDESYKKMGANGGAGEKPADFGPHEAAYNFRTNVIPIGITGPAGSTIQTSGSLVPSSVSVGADGARTSLQNAVNLRKIADVNAAFTVNGDKVNPRNTAITGNTYVQYLPISKDRDGKMAVDQEGAKKWAQIQKQHPDASPEQLASQYGAQLNLQKVVVAEATSFSDSRAGWLDGRDPNYYQAISGDEEKDLADIIDPKRQKGVTHGFLVGGDNTAHKHLVIMPALDELSWREADGNHATLPAKVFSANPFNADGSVNPNAFNTGVGGANLNQPVPYQSTQPVPANLTSDWFKSK